MLRLSRLISGKIKSRRVGDGHVGHANAGAEARAVAGGAAAAVAQNVQLPEADVILAMVYPPVFRLHRKHHDKISTVPNSFSLHGTWECKSLPKPLQQKIDRVAINKFQFEADLLNRLNTAIAQLDLTPEQLIKREMTKHAKNIPFLTTVPDFAEFALDCYEKYQFAQLFDFIVQTIGEEGIGKDEVYLGMHWVGVRVNDLLRIANSFTPIQDLHGQVNLQLVERGGSKYFLHDITICLTREGLPATRCDRQPEVYLKRKKKKKIARDSYVYLFLGE